MVRSIKIWIWIIIISIIVLGVITVTGFWPFVKYLSIDQTQSTLPQWGVVHT